MSFFKQLVRRKPDVEFFTRLSVEECQQRLSATLGDWWRIWDFRPDRLVIGNVSGFRFHLYKKLYTRDSFIPILYGELIPTPQGTYVRGSFRWSTITTIFFILWFGALGLAVSTVCQGAVTALSGNSYCLALPVGFLVLGVLFVWIGPLLEHTSKGYVIAYLHRTLLDSRPSSEASSISTHQLS